MMKLARQFVILMVIGIGAIVWFGYELGWKAAVALFLALWANNASIEIGQRAQRQQRGQQWQMMAAARRRIRTMAQDAGSAAPSGDARVSAQNGGHTNTEAEVTGRESP